MDWEHWSFTGHHRPLLEVPRKRIKEISAILDASQLHRDLPPRWRRVPGVGPSDGFVHKQPGPTTQSYASLIE